MTYAIEYTQPVPTSGGSRSAVTGEHHTIADAKRAAERAVAREGVTDVVVRDNGDNTSAGAGDLVSELIDGVWHDRGIFDVQNWWPKLDDDTRAWLLEHAGEQVSTEILHRIIAAGGTVAGVQWEGQDEYDFRLPDEASDWIVQQR